MIFVDFGKACNVDSDNENEDEYVGRQVGVRFEYLDTGASRVDPGIITKYDVVTGLFTIEFDDETVTSDIKFSEIIFMD